ncbi:hypothetical protein BU23DRAFT_595501 [Bimuria novae-zelandiae CBS 107.79]|uniref:Structure-specific endonuclease subunit SLX4 n=1 Tax=Bimuria novae-zelandiae CBS 107.79 TaxID=1447943 RepID=A0A6A5VMU0_9PLEO|nr:hypothetical protein BU23DRAFT_595501 [Bimuria novae-zelandiae CBS 107.79]
MAGSTYDAVVLSSSPPTAPDAAPLSPASPEQRVAMPATSSWALSPLTRPKRATPGAFRSGSRAAPVPDGVGRGFATARSLLVDININDRGLSAIEEAIEASRAPTDGIIKATKKPRKRAAKPTVGEPTEKPKAKRGQKPKASNAGGDDGAATTSSHFAKLPAPDADTDANAPTREIIAPTTETKAVKPRKPRAKKATTGDGETQATITTAKVTKPRAPRKTTKKAKGKAAEVVSAHFRSRATVDDAVEPEEERTTNAEGSKPTIGDEAIWDVPLSPSARSRGPRKQRPPDPELPLDLDVVVGRRTDWTPPPETMHQDIVISSTGKENNADAVVTTHGAFSTILSGYSYAHLSAPPENPSSRSASTEPVGVMKRRRVELLDVPGNQAASHESSPEKRKAPKKKPRTITDLVTGQYAPQPLPESPEVTSDFFARRTAAVVNTTKVLLNDITAAEKKKPIRKRVTSKPTSDAGKSKAKSKKASAKTAAKPKLVAEKLLSPTSAALRMNRQDLLFGTSSQLALDESPTMVREIQKATRESEHDADFRERIGDVDAPDIKVWLRLKKTEGRRALWRASSRDDEGGMLDRQAVFLPEPDRAQDFPLLIGDSHETSEDEFLDIDDFPPPPPKAQVPIPISSDLQTPPPTVTNDKSGEDNDAATNSSFFDIDDFPQDPPPSGQNPDSSFFDIDDFAPPAQAASYSASTGSSTKKRRGRPPKSQFAIPPRTTASAPTPTLKKPSSQARLTTAASPSTPKRGKTRFHAIEEILDSEDDEALSPTPPRTHRLEDSPPLAFVADTISTSAAAKEGLVTVYKIPEAHLAFDALRPTLFPAITALIRSLPPSTDISRPSWHEKILMYDPIVVEDFTTFLNTHEQIHAYQKATQKQVKVWNKELKRRREEEDSVEGSAETVEGDGCVLAVRKEVEVGMVQKWCEEMSVCCVSRGKKGGGVKKGLY